MGADTPAVSSTVEHGGFTFNGTGAAEAVEAIKADDKARAAKGKPEGEGLSEAASELGKKGGKAAAEARAAKQAESEKAKPANTETEAEAEPEKKAATSEDDAEELDKHPRAKARVQEATRKAKEAREEAQREREARIRAEARAEALERAPRAEPQRRPAQEEAPSDEPQLDSYLTKHGAGGETKALSEWVSDRDKWRDGQAQERQQAQKRVEGMVQKQGAVYKELKSVIDADPEYWPAVEDIAAELVPSEGINAKTGQYYRVERPAAMNWLANELHEFPDMLPKVLKYLSENRDDLATLKSYRTEKDIVRAFSLIVAHVGGATAGNPSPSERPVSKPVSSMAPPPVRPVTGAPSSASGADPMPREGESFDSWNRRTAGKRAAAR